MPPIDPWVSAAIALAGILATLFGTWVNKKLGQKNAQNEANRDLNTTWDSIVENLQNQITALGGDVKDLKAKTEDLEERLGVKERLILRAIAHFIVLEALLHALGGAVPPRPEGLE